jgi:predicted nucleic acid-binding Zn ribbon protein
MVVKKCEECNEEFEGRIDKKFCSDQCRNTYNNRQNKDTNNTVRNINYILRKNRRILEELNPHGKSRTTASKMEAKGFNFSYFTSEYITKNGAVYRYVYDQGYLKLDDNNYALVIKKDYID